MTVRQIVVTNFTYRYGRFEVQAPAWHAKKFLGKDPKEAVDYMGVWFRRNNVLRGGIEAEVRIGKCKGCYTDGKSVYALT